MAKDQQQITLGIDDLTKLVATMVQESRKPEPPSAKELADLEMEQEQRKATAESVKEKNKNRRYMQEKICTHEHLKSAGGGTHCVWVRDNDILASSGYVYCQKCEGRFRPDDPLMRKLDPDAIFDTQKFNLLMQDCVQIGAEILG